MVLWFLYSNHLYKRYTDVYGIMLNDYHLPHELSIPYV
jgi:hypothetical protein